MKLGGDSSLHFVSLRMTDTCVFERGGGWRLCLQPPPLDSLTHYMLVILSEAKNLLLLTSQY